MNLPQVSICIPAYKADVFIAETLASVSAQSFSDWEVIVTEDGTKDSTEELVTLFAKTVTQSVVYNRHAVNRGLPHTRNTGISTTRGQWIAFLDADDLWQPDHLETLVARAKETDSDLIFAGSRIFDHESRNIVGQQIPTEKHLGALPLSLFMGWLSVMPSSVLIRRGTFERFGLVSTEFPHVNDTEYWLRVLRGGGRVSYSGKATCLYRRHASSMSQRSAEIQEDSALLCERYAKWEKIPSHLQHSRPADLFRWAANTVSTEDPEKAMRLLIKSLHMDPRNIKTLLRCLGVAARHTWWRLHGNKNNRIKHDVPLYQVRH